LRATWPLYGRREKSVLHEGANRLRDRAKTRRGGISDGVNRCYGAREHRLRTPAPRARRSTDAMRMHVPRRVGCFALARGAHGRLFHQTELHLELQLGSPMRLCAALGAFERFGRMRGQELAALVADVRRRRVAVTGFARLQLREPRPRPGVLAP